MSLELILDIISTLASIATFVGVCILCKHKEP